MTAAAGTTRGRTTRRSVAAELAALRPPTPIRSVRVRSADGTGLHAEVYGLDRAPTIVLAHGITCSLRAWTYQIRELATRYRVVAYDQRGHGRSDRPYRRDRFAIDNLGRDLQAVLEQCIPDGRPAVLAGHSMGGITIMSWAGLFPDEVQRRAAAVALVNTAAAEVLQHSGSERMLRSVRVVGRGVARTPVYTPILLGSRSAMRWLVFGDRATPVDLALLAALIHSCPPRTRANFARHLVSMDLHPGLANLTVPTLVVAGQRDRLLPAVHSARIAADLPHLLGLDVLPGVGHMAPFESSAQVTRLLCDLADRYAPAAPDRNRSSR